MIAQIGSLNAGRKILYTEIDGDTLTVSRLVVGRQKQDQSGRPVVELKKPMGKRTFKYVSADTIVGV